MAGWKNISDNLARLHAFWTAHTASARPGPPPNRAARRGPRACPSSHAGGVRRSQLANAKRSGGRGRNANQPAPGRVPPAKHTSRSWARHADADDARRQPATRTSNGSTHGARPPAGYGGRPLATASIVQGPSCARVHVLGRRCPIHGSCGILGRARVVWRVLLSAGQPLVLPSKLPPNQTTGLASGSSIC